MTMDSSTASSVAAELSPTLAETQELLPSFLHDLNNLLGIVLGNAELLLDPGDHADKRARRTQSIYNAALKAKDLVADLHARIS